MSHRRCTRALIFVFGEYLAGAYAQPEAVDEEMVLAAAMLPEAQREQFVQTMEAAREGLRARMQQEWTEASRVKAEQVLTHTHTHTHTHKHTHTHTNTHTHTHTLTYRT